MSIEQAPEVSRGPNAKPHVQWNHIDGPLLTCADGTPHWLTLWERLALRAGITTLEALDARYNSQPQRC